MPNWALLGDIGPAFNDAYDASSKQAALRKIGGLVQSGDYDGAGAAAFGAGDLSAGATLLTLAQQAKNLRLQREADGSALSVVGGGADATTASGANPSGVTETSSGGGRRSMVMPADPETEAKSVATWKGGGLTNPYGLAALAAHANAESGFSPGNIGGSWSDPSQSGAAGTSGGLLSWRNDRLGAMRAATQGAADPVVAQAKYALTENPEVAIALQNAKSPEEANSILANAQRYAGWNQPGGETAKRLAMTRGYLGRLNSGGIGGAQPPAGATADAPTGPPVSADGTTQSAVIPDPFGGGPGVKTAMLPREGGGGWIPVPPSRPTDVAGSPGGVQVASADPNFVPSASGPAPAAADPEVKVPNYPGTWSRARIEAAPDGTDVPDDHELKAAQDAALSGGATQPSAPVAQGMPVPLPSLIPAPAPVPTTVAPGVSRMSLDSIEKVLLNPNLSSGVRSALSTIYANKLHDAEIPAGVKEWRWAKANGLTDAASPNAYAAERQRDEGEKIDAQATARAKQARAYGLDPETPEGRRFVLTGQMPAGRDATIDAQTAARARQAEQFGLDPATPEGQRFVLTGQMPDPAKAGEMKATEQKLYAANVEKTNILSQQIKDLEKARQLNPQVYSGNFEPGAAQWAGRNLPFGGMGLVAQDRVTATTQYENLVNGATLSQGKELFGARPTNYDEKLLQALKASPNMTPQERDTILGQMVEHRKQLLQETADNTAAMKQGTFFKRGTQGPGGAPVAPAAGSRPAASPASPGPGSQTVIPPGAVEMLRSNPALATQFDAKYGPGSSANVLGR